MFVTIGSIYRQESCNARVVETWNQLQLQSKSQQSQPYEDGPSSVRRIILSCEHMGIIRKTIRNG